MRLWAAALSCLVVCAISSTEEYSTALPKRTKRSSLVRGDCRTRHRHQWYGSQTSTVAREVIGTAAAAVNGSTIAKPLCSLLIPPAGAEEGGLWTVCDEHLQWEPKHCSLRRLDQAEARKCLRSQHIVFVGDSLSRYHYLSLCHFLANGQYPVPFDHADGPALTNQKEWPDWQQYYAGASRMLTQVATEGNASETCDCQRKNPGFPNEIAHEERHFELRFPLTGHNEQSAHPYARIRVSFVLIFSHPSFELVGRNAMQYVFKDLATTLQPPDILIMNMGFWITKWAPEAEMQQHFQNIMQQAVLLRKEAGLCTKLLWKTTSTVKGQDQPASQDFQGWISSLARQAAEITPPWAVMDVRAVTRAAARQGLNLHIQQDGIHFRAAMYEAWNELLLNMLCTPDTELALKPC